MTEVEQQQQVSNLPVGDGADLKAKKEAALKEAKPAVEKTILGNKIYLSLSLFVCLIIWIQWIYFIFIQKLPRYQALSSGSMSRTAMDLSPG